MPIVVRNLETQEPVQHLPPTRGATPPAAEPAPATSGCCGGAAPAGADACCALDADVKSAGGSGCGCGTPAAAPKASGCC